MRKRLLVVLMCILALTVSSPAASKHKKKTHAPAPTAPDKKYLQKLMDGWSSGDPANMTQYYDQGEYTFFDIAPLKYNNWAAFQKGVTELLKNYKTFKLTVNDDAQIHTDGNLTWVAATVKEDAVTAAGKHELATLRWTVIFEKQAGKWMIVHEHTSEPLQ
jgi:ketosteroid isomerase-like protein